jgi:hypothetical protein
LNSFGFLRKVPTDFGSGTRFEHVHAALGKPLLIRIAGVNLRLLDRVPSEHSHELVRRRAVVRRYRRARLPQTMSTAGHVRFYAAVPEPIAESRVRKTADRIR